MEKEMITTRFKHPLDDIIPNPLWPDKKDDVSDAVDMLAKHMDPKYGFRLIESFKDNRDNFKITISKWMEDLLDFFIPLYGVDTIEIINQITFILTGSSDADTSGKFRLKKTYKRIKFLEAKF
jgi:hypothetical protein